MDAQLFKRLMASPESNILDFKLAGYDLRGDKEQEDAKFIKDLLSFSNTVRRESAYIIAGVFEKGGAFQLNGLADFPDDAILQQKAMDKIWPKPVFSSYRFTYKGLVFGIIEIPVFNHPRPLVAVKPLKGLQVDTVYFRRGSANSPASASEVLTIYDWLQSLRLSVHDRESLKKEAGELTGLLADNAVPLPGTLSRCLTLAKKIGEPLLEEFCVKELTGYKNTGEGNPEQFPFRVVKIPATPYEISFPEYQNTTADRLLSEMSRMEQFRVVHFFLHYSITELEDMIANTSGKQALLSIKMPTKSVFPEIKKTDIPKATLFFGAAVLREAVLAIRKHALTLLISLDFNRD